MSSADGLNPLPPHFRWVEKQMDDGRFSAVKTMLLMRHAPRIVANKDTIAEFGVAGLQLTDKGRQEAQLFGNHLAGMDLTKGRKIKFHSSDIKRCTDTLYSIAKGYFEEDQDIVIHEHGMLRGWFIGRPFADAWMESIVSGKPDAVDAYVRSGQEDNVGELSLKQAADKLVAFLLTILDKREDALVLACTHDIVLTFIVGAFFNPGKIETWSQIPQFLEVTCVQCDADDNVRLIYRKDQIIIPKERVAHIRQTYTKFETLRSNEKKAEQPAVV